MRLPRPLLFAALGLMVAWSPLLNLGCDGQASPRNLSEPIQVEGAQFIVGDLPGVPPPDPKAMDGGVDAAPVDPTITFYEAQNRIIRPGEAGKRLDGRTTPDAVAVGIRFADLGTGYWVLPVASPDPQNNGELTWSATCDFAHDLPIGIHPLRFAAIDGNGGSGSEGGLDVCLVPPYPDNDNACDPTIAPPAVVVSLSWDTPVDLDVRLVLPSGDEISPKSPSNQPIPDGGTAKPAAKSSTYGTLDRDSNADCVIDGQSREDVVFQKQPPAGIYQVYANLFDACGQEAVHFTVSLYLSSPSPDGKTFSVRQVLSQRGELVASQANGGAGPGLFVTQFALDLAGSSRVMSLVFEVGEVPC